MAIQKCFVDTKLDELLKNGTDWKSSDTRYTDAKGEIKRYLEGINRKTCFFCKSKIKTGNNAATLEHILDKMNYNMYIYKPENLTYACSNCNSLKRNDNVLSDEELEKGKIYTYDNYPSNSNDYIIVHPYLDDYYEYIDIDDIFYIAKDGKLKGENTIKLYHLRRLDLAEDKIKMDPNAFKIKFLRDYFTMGINITDAEKAVDYIFDNINEDDDDVYTPDLPLRFIDNHLNPDDERDSKLLKAINLLDENKVEIFSEFRKLANQINTDPNYDYSNIVISDFYKLDNEKQLLEKVDIVLKSLYRLLRSNERVKEVNKMNSFEIYTIISKFGGYMNQSHKNKHLEVIPKLRNLVFCVELYKQDNTTTKNIKEKISDDQTVLETIRNELIKIRSMKKVSK